MQGGGEKNEIRTLGKIGILGLRGKRDPINNTGKRWWRRKSAVMVLDNHSFLHVHVTVVPIGNKFLALNTVLLKNIMNVPKTLQLLHKGQMQQISLHSQSPEITTTTGVWSLDPPQCCPRKEGSSNVLPSSCPLVLGRLFQAGYVATEHQHTLDLRVLTPSFDSQSLTAAGQVSVFHMYTVYLYFAFEL